MIDEEKISLAIYTIIMKGRNMQARDRVKASAYTRGMRNNLLNITFPLINMVYLGCKHEASDYLILILRSNNEGFCISDFPALEGINIRGVKIGTFMPITPKTAIGIMLNNEKSCNALHALDLEDQGTINICEEETTCLNLQQIENCSHGAYFKTQEQAQKYLGLLGTRAI